jgi:hypothetical protein
MPNLTKLSEVQHFGLSSPKLYLVELERYSPEIYDELASVVQVDKLSEQAQFSIKIYHKLCKEWYY